MANNVIITAAGVGKRMNSKINKVLIQLNGEPIIVKTIRVFQDSPAINQIILVGRSEEILELQYILDKHAFSKVGGVIKGGNERQDSVYNGLKALKANDDDIVLIHNGANPFVDERTIKMSIEAAAEFGASVVGFPSRDTIKEVNKDKMILKTLDRSSLWQVQTPQVMKYGIAKKAFETAYADNFYGTDDVMLAERIGIKVKMVECPPENIKLTLPSDIYLASQINGAYRVGLGMDSHRFTQDKEKSLVLGGVEIPSEQGLEANSDGDVILHALFNAISQAIGEKSIGFYADKMCEDGIKDSKEYLKLILDIMHDKGYQINNVGIMIEAKKPSILKIESQIKGNLVKLCHISEEQVGITATSGEGLTPFGKGLGIQCFAIITINKRK